MLEMASGIYSSLPSLSNVIVCCTISFFRNNFNAQPSTSISVKYSWFYFELPWVIPKANSVDSYTPGSLIVHLHSSHLLYLYRFCFALATCCSYTSVKLSSLFLWLYCCCVIPENAVVTFFWIYGCTYRFCVLT